MDAQSVLIQCELVKDNKRILNKKRVLKYSGLLFITVLTLLVAYKLGQIIICPPLGFLLPPILAKRHFCLTIRKKEPKKAPPKKRCYFSMIITCFNYELYSSLYTVSSSISSAILSSRSLQHVVGGLISFKPPNLSSGYML